MLCLIQSPSTAGAFQQPSQTEQADKPSIVIVDGSIGNLESILADLRQSGRSYRILTGKKNPISEIADIVTAAGNVQSIHLISHGSQDALVFDGKILGAGELENHAADLKRIGAAMAVGGDILLYGCAVAGAEDKGGFLERFAQLSGRDVAASKDSTGASALGGNWELETSEGEIETASMEFADWPGLLVYATSTLNWTTAANLTKGVTANYTYNGSATALQFTIAGSGTITNDYTASFTGGTGDQTTLMQPATTSVTTGQTVTMVFNSPGFADGIQTVTFDLRNIDASAGGWDDRLLVTAFDTNNVQLAGSNITATPRQVSGQTYSVTTLAGGVQLDGNIDGTAGDNSPQDSVGLSITSTTGARIGRVVVLYTSGTAGTTTGIVGIGDIGMTYNLPPSAKNDTIAFSTATYTGNLFSNNGAGVDSDGNSDTFSVTAVDGAAFTVGSPIAVSGGTVSITNAATGAFTFTPGAAYGGSQIFTYTITDQYGLTSTATVTLTSPVTAANDTFTGTPINGVSGGSTATVFTNDLFLGSAVTSTNVNVTLTANGGLAGAVLNANGTITVPAGSAAGTYTLSYQICHKQLVTNCATATASVLVASTPAPSGSTSCTGTNLATNGGIESPAITLGGQSIVGTGAVPGWSTNDTGIEIWSTGFNGVPSHTGNQFLEMNANIGTSILVQAPSAVQKRAELQVYWAHRGRAGNDTANLTVSDNGGGSTSSGNFTTGTAAWIVRNMQHVVSANGTAASLSFDSVVSSGGASYGNFIDTVEVCQTYVTITKTLASRTDVDGSTTDTAGDLLVYQYAISNPAGNARALASVSVTDDKIGTLAVPTPASGDANTNGFLDPGETWIATANYTVTQPDINAASVTNIAYASGSTGTSTIRSDDTSLNVTFTQAPSHSIVKTQSSGSNPVTAAGQTIGYTVTVANTGNVSLTSVSLTDALTQGAASLTLTSALTLSSGDTNSNSILDIGETWNYSASFTVTQPVVDDGGNISNVATVDTAQTTPLASAPVTTPVTQTRTLLFAKSAILNGNPVGLPVTTALAAGDVVTYRYDVTNTGNVTMSNVGVSDSHNGNNTLPVPGGETMLADAGTVGDSTDAIAANSQWSSLAPGDAVRFTATYTVNQSDVDLLQ